jgi:PAS domain-containing protein
MMAFTREANGEPIIEDCNSRFADKLGYSREELLEQPLANVYTETSTE